MGLTPHPRLVPKVLEKSTAIPLLTQRACVAYKRGENLPTSIRFSFLATVEACVFLYGTYVSSGFGGLGVACWPLVPKFASSNPAEAVGFLGRKKSSTRLPSEGK